jgi:hypothetical protein
MDKLINAGKEFLEDRSQQSQQSQQSQAQSYDQGSSGRQAQSYDQGMPGGNKAYGGNYPAGGGFSVSANDDDDDDDFRTAKDEAAARAGSSGSNDLFSSILGSIGQNKSRIQNEDLDEADAVRKHKKAYDGNDSDADEDSLGTAAAIQALKLFNKGETGGKQSQGAFIGLALSEASKLFDNKSAEGKVSSSASKESTIQKAGEVAMKMYFKSQGQQQGGLMGLASKFL